MSMTAAYWALGALKPSVIAMIGCDMVYPANGPTHFYGIGAADPLRDDISLRSLEAKSARFMIMAAQRGCATVNLSRSQSRLIYPGAERANLASVQPMRFDPDACMAALRAETEAAYMEPSGRYWSVTDRFDPSVIDEIDTLWLRAAETADYHPASRIPRNRAL